MNLIHIIANYLSPEAQNYKRDYEAQIEATKKAEEGATNYYMAFKDENAKKQELIKALKEERAEHNKLVLAYNEVCLENSRMLRDLEAEKLAYKLMCEHASNLEHELEGYEMQVDALEGVQDEQEKKLRKIKEILG